MSGWIGVDLDGTLAEYGRWKGAGHIGEPVPAMLERVKEWIAEGRTVKIMTARASYDPDGSAVREVQAWCLKHVGRELPVTCTKDYAMLELWDDRAVQVEVNTGRRMDDADRLSSLAQLVSELMAENAELKTHINRSRDAFRAGG